MRAPVDPRRDRWRHASGRDGAGDRRALVGSPPASCRVDRGGRGCAAFGPCGERSAGREPDAGSLAAVVTTRRRVTASGGCQRGCREVRPRIGGDGHGAGLCRLSTSPFRFDSGSRLQPLRRQSCKPAGRCSRPAPAGAPAAVENLRPTLELRGRDGMTVNCTRLKRPERVRLPPELFAASAAPRTGWTR